MGRERPLGRGRPAVFTAVSAAGYRRQRRPQEGGTIGSTTILEPAGMWLTIHARARFRVSGRDRTASSWMSVTTLWARSRAPASTAAPTVAGRRPRPTQRTAWTT